MYFDNEYEIARIMNALKKERNNIYPNLKRVYDNITAQFILISEDIKKELLASFKKIAYEEFQKKFYEEYGNNYDVNSLNSCLSFYIKDDFTPVLTYDKSKFIIKSDFDSDRRAFNQNVRIDGSYSELMELDEMDLLEENDFYDLSSDDIDPYDYAMDEISPPEEYEVFRPRRLIKDTAIVFKEAEASTYAAYKDELSKGLENRIMSKYRL